MSNRRNPKRARAQTNATRPNTTNGAPGQLSWLKRIQQAPSVANLIALAALVVALPAGLLAWHQLDKEGTSLVANDNKAVRATVPDSPVPPGNSAANAAPTALPLAPAKSTVPAASRTVTLTSPDRVDRTAEADRPALNRASATVTNVALDKQPIWLVTIENDGRPANFLVNNTVELSDLDGPAITLSCAQVAQKVAPVQFARGANTAQMSGASLNEKDWEAYNRGVPLMLAATYCSMDDVTGKKYVKHICLKHYVNGSMLGCRRNND